MKRLAKWTGIGLAGIVALSIVATFGAEDAPLAPTPTPTPMITADFLTRGSGDLILRERFDEAMRQLRKPTFLEEESVLLAMSPEEFAGTARILDRDWHTVVEAHAKVLIIAGELSRLDEDDFNDMLATMDVDSQSSIEAFASLETAGYYLLSAATTASAEEFKRFQQWRRMANVHFTVAVEIGKESDR